MPTRIIGFDLARTLAIFGMFMVNFNFAFGTFANDSGWAQFLNFFIGKATAIFIILAGMGLSFMAQQAKTPEEQKRLRKIIFKRSFILFLLGLLLFSWWPGDILHFYGGYMHLAALALFIRKGWHLFLAIIVVGIFHGLLFLIPIDTSWNLNDFSYTDFWTPIGFLRNTFYNGWNSIFPWFAYFLLGMFLGRVKWEKEITLVSTFAYGFFLYLLIILLQSHALGGYYGEYFTHYFLAEYFPAYLPFMLKTIGFALMVIPACFYIGKKWGNSRWLITLSKTGRMTLSLYVFNITVGMLLFGSLVGINYTGALQQGMIAEAKQIALFGIGFFILCVCLCIIWLKKFKYGPLEYLLRIKEKHL